jgi:hypothetical protein
VCGAKKEREVSFVGSEGCDQNFCATVYNSKPCFVCFGAASPRTLSSGRKGTMLASRQQTTVADENKKHVEQHGGKPIPPSKRKITISDSLLVFSICLLTVVSVDESLRRGVGLDSCSCRYREAAQQQQKH